MRSPSCQQSMNSFGSRATLEVRSASYEFFRLDAVEGAARLPFSLKVLLENLLRTEDGANVTADQIRALAQLGPDGRARHRDPVHAGPRGHAGLHRRARVVDLATMREAMVDLGGDAAKINPLAPAELVIDHSVIADVFGRRDAFDRNVELEYERNQERYQFLRWGQTAFDEFKVVPPGTGIVHQVNIEYLARVVFARDGVRLPRHPRRHRLAHHDGQRPRRARLGRRRHRGRGGDARPAGLHADPAGRRLQADRRAARGRHRHRPGAHHHRDAAQARRGRQVRRVLRRRRRRGAAGQPRHHRQHEPGVRLDLRDLPDRRGDAELPAAHRPHGRADRAGRGVRQGAGLWHDPTAEPVYSETLELDLVDRRAVASPARSARRTGCRWPRPSRRSARRSATTSTATRCRTPSTRSVAESFPASDPAGAERAPTTSRDAVGRATARTAARRTRSTVTLADGSDVRARPRRGRDRRDHLVHQHLQPVRDDRRRAAGQEGRREGPDPQAVGQDHAGARLQGRHRLLRPRRPDALPGQARLQPGRLRLHDLHRQLRPAASRRSRPRSTRPTSRSRRCCRATATSRAGSTPT